MKITADSQILPGFLFTEHKDAVLGWKLNADLGMVLKLLQAIGVAAFFLFLLKPSVYSRYGNLMNSEK